MDKYKGLYVHIPFCVQKCRYCDFTSFSGCEHYIDRYIDAVLCEADKYRGTVFETVFVGGGTPTLFNEAQLDRLFSGLEKIFVFTDDCECSIEANPKTLNIEKISVLKSHIVNRISIGVQSFDDKELSVLGRIHTSTEALESIELVSKHFDNFNLDIMTSVPYQTQSSLMRTLDTAAATGAAHLSCYSLIIEEGTEFYNLFSEGKLTKPTDEEDREMYSMLVEHMHKNGFERYEISNFAKGGRRCRHNIKYWTTNEYIGIGAAAHSYVGDVRFSNTDNLEDYICGNFKREKEILSEKDKISEYIMMSMRLTDGLSEREFYERFKKSFSDINPAKLDLYIKNGFIKRTSGGFAFTDKGFDVSNSILCDFI